jgi:hypothetical protein
MTLIEIHKQYVIDTILVEFVPTTWFALTIVRFDEKRAPLKEWVRFKLSKK